MKNIYVVFQKNMSYLNPLRIFGVIRRNGVVKPVKKLIAVFTNIFYELVFDKIYRVETSKIVAVNELDIPAENKNTSVRYRPVNYNALRKALKYLSSCIDVREASFFDIGCGKGRALVAASLYHFKNVFGLELSEKLVQHCRQDVAKLIQQKKLATNLTVVCGDATSYDYPASINVYFLYQPFSEAIYRQVLARIIRCHQQPIYILEVTPRRRALFKSFGFTHVHAIDDGLGDPHTIIDIYKYDSKPC